MASSAFESWAAAFLASGLLATALNSTRYSCNDLDPLWDGD
ncbi:MAG TPA: hypothetical protein VHK00_09210 [Miltoncostaeaceae bacterium]|nr:hypothetical protein [Miltoncostaeaceae bacterium]